MDWGLLMAPPRNGSRDGIVSRVVFFVVAIGIVFGVFQYVTGGVKVGDDGWFRTGHQKISELFDRGAEVTKGELEDITDGVRTQIREQLPTTPTQAPAPEDEAK